MAKASSTAWYKWLLAISSYIAIYIVVIGEDYLLKMVQAEDRMNRIVYSDPVAERATQRGNDWFTTVFVDTRIMEHSFAPFIPTAEERASVEHLGMQDFGQPLFVWFENRMRVWWTLVWSTFTRVSSVLLWAPYTLLILVPLMVDGWTQRERRKHTFEFASPVKQRYAISALIWMPILFMLMLSAPIAMHPLITPACIFGFGLLMQTGIANFMKRA